MAFPNIAITAASRPTTLRYEFGSALPTVGVVAVTLDLRLRLLAGARAAAEVVERARGNARRGDAVRLRDRRLHDELEGVGAVQRVRLGLRPSAHARRRHREQCEVLPVAGH
jgi:hypothetical protein